VLYKAPELRYLPVLTPALSISLFFTQELCAERADMLATGN
jgi:hypothetical protein